MEMEDFEDFEAVFGSLEEVEFYRDEIKQNRRDLEGDLFVDRMLRAIGLSTPSRIYPPGSPDDLWKLHKRIVDSSSPDHYKQSLIYYLLQDCESDHYHRAAKFARVSFLPDKYKIFVDGLWHLDRFEFEAALDFLTEPVLIPTFSEDILYTLCCHVPEDDSTLPLAYYHTVSVPITSSKVLEAFFLISCRASVTEAFFFSRSQGELTQRGLFERLIDFVLTGSEGALRASRSAELVTLPLNENEESWLKEYLEEGDGKRSQGAADTLILRAMMTGRFGSIRNQSEIARDRKINDLNWASLRDRMDRASNQDGLLT